MILRILAFLLICQPALSQVDTRLLSTETLVRTELVPEFAFIQKEADRLGVKVYLFGGTASAFAHYVRWDLEREAGDTKYQAERFDYDFTNIYRGNQDLDIVVDGTAEQAAQLQQVLKENFPHFVGDKDAWEVRLLQAQIGDKLPLLGDFDFLNQHTDTNSTGMIAINPDESDLVFRDLFSWEDPESQFLKDVANGEIKFLFSKTHEKTSRFKEEKNPPIFAAVRYLAKLAQYEVMGIPEDLTLIKKIIKETNWKEIKGNPYVKHKLEEFGKKVLLNAPDSEYAWNLLEETDLRKELLKMDGDQTQAQDSLSWWMNKEPLRSKKIGQGRGRTAKTIFKEKGIAEFIVSHETNSFIAYENITRSSKGKANAFISRRNINGEAAMHGDGFYTQIGHEGAAGTGLTIRFQLDPKARENSDFIYAGSYIVVTNKAVLTLVQENLDITLLEFYKLLNNGDFSLKDRGLLEKLSRKFKRSKSISTNEEDELAEYIAEVVAKKKNPQALVILQMWFSSPLSLNYPHIFEYITTKLSPDTDVFLILHKSPLWTKHPDMAKTLKRYAQNKRIVRDLVTTAFSIHKPQSWLEYPDFENILDVAVKTERADQAVLRYLMVTREYWKHRPKFIKWITAIAKRGKVNQDLTYLIRNTDTLKTNISILKLLKPIAIKGDQHSNLIETVRDSQLINNPQALSIIKIIMKDEKHTGNLLRKVFSSNEFLKQNLPLSIRFINKLIKENKHHEVLIQNVLQNDIWKEHPETLTKMIYNLLKYGNAGSAVALHLLLQEHVRLSDDFISLFELALDKAVRSLHFFNLHNFVILLDHPKIEKIIFLLLKNLKKQNVAALGFELLGLLDWRKYPEAVTLFEEAITVNSIFVQSALAEDVFSNSHWFDHPKIKEWVSQIIKKRKGTDELIKSIVSQDIQTHSDFVFFIEMLLQIPRTVYVNTRFIFNKYVFFEENINTNLLLKNYLNGQPWTAESFRKRKPVFSKWIKQRQNLQCRRALSN